MAAAALVVVVVAVAYATSAPQLGVAEFAPAARRVDPEAPATTGAAGSASRSGPSSRSGRESTTTTAEQGGATTGAPPTTQVARARECVEHAGGVMLQTADPLSPRCAATIFEGDNGGATSLGVTPTEVRVGIPTFTGFTSSADYVAYREAVGVIVEHLNRRFEMYGRRIVPVYVEGNAATPEGARALGAELGGQHPFGAVTGFSESNLAQVALLQELARAEIVTTTRNQTTWWSDRLLFDQLHPYLWSVHQSSEDQQANLADMACSMLAGKQARFGDAGRKGEIRRFGILAMGRVLVPRSDVLSDRLTACTGAAPVRAEGTGGSVDQVAIERLKNAGVTTVVCLCEYYFVSNGVGRAASAGYHPEWIVTNSTDDNMSAEGWVQGARAGDRMLPPIRLVTGRRFGPIQTRPFFAAMADVDPTLLQRTTDIARTLHGLENMYEPLLVMAAGIQAAGPGLTPESFAAGLMAMQFPNPGAGQAPLWSPSAGFGPGDHSFYDDYAVAWWSDTAPAVDPYASKGQGSWCYLDQGARFRVGSYPTTGDTRLFDPNQLCR